MPSTPEQVTWVECPRDAWQGLKHVPSTAAKLRHIQDLLAAGFNHLDLGSFVSPTAVPQMADTEALLRDVVAGPGVDLLCIIANERGLARASAANGVTSVGYPLSVSDTFQRRNVGRSVADSWELVTELGRQAKEAGIELVVYLSMGFGNPYGDPWSPTTTAAAVARLRAAGITRIAAADTLGNANAAAIEAVLDAVPEPGGLGLHLHAAPGAWRDKLAVALRYGVRWFEGALGGIGGCPFAADELVGNLPTEHVLPWLVAEGLDVAPDLTALPDLAGDAHRLAHLGA